MTPSDAPWTATVSIALADRVQADWLASALGPESAREVPRAGATIGREAPATVRIDIRAADAGAMRAALNTYLGWVGLAIATARTAAAGPRAPVPE